MPLAKTAVQELSQPATITPQPPDTLSRLDIGGVPVDLFRTFDLPLTLPEKEVNKLKDIYEWSKIGLDEPTIGNSLIKIRNLELRLGSASTGKEKINKLWNWVRMAMNMEELKRRQIALER